MPAPSPSAEDLHGAPARADATGAPPSTEFDGEGPSIRITTKHLVQWALTLLLVVVSGGGLVWLTGALLSGDKVVDQGDRGLLIISTSGGDRSYTMHMRLRSSPRHEMTATFYFTAKKIVYPTDDKPSNSSPITLNVTFSEGGSAGSDTQERVTCGTSSDPIQRQPFEELDAGARAAILADVGGGSASAINYNGPNNADIISRAQAGLYSQWSSLQWLNPEDASFSERDADWAESCTIPASVIWRSPASTPWPASPSVTLLPPQIDFTSIDDKTTFQDYLVADMSIQRPEGITLKEAYPGPTSAGSQWSYELASEWMGSRGEPGNLGYTDQPVWIFENRQLADWKALWFTLLGVGVAVLATTVVSILSRLVNLIAGLMGKKWPWEFSVPRP